MGFWNLKATPSDSSSNKTVLPNPSQIVQQLRTRHSNIWAWVGGGIFTQTTTETQNLRLFSFLFSHFTDSLVNYPVIILRTSPEATNMQQIKSPLLPATCRLQMSLLAVKWCMVLRSLKYVWILLQSNSQSRIALLGAGRTLELHRFWEESKWVWAKWHHAGMVGTGEWESSRENQAGAGVATVSGF